ncbi:MAG: ADP-ribose diphosphatase [Candidatus Accumulibacter phosphatis]|jgi:ADP-ribose pyrophosphatase|nr:ADP-ribose diphosphatase [Candidatus Accumulibacter phosphatis]
MPGKTMKAKILQSEAAYTGFFQLRRLTVEHELFDGGDSGPQLREILHRSDVAAALLYDARADEVVLVEQYRAGAHLAGENPWLIDIVAGRIETGQTPLATITREIAEEAGLTPTAIEPIGVYLTAPHLSSERLYLYCATVEAGKVAGFHGLAHEGEDIRPLVLARSAALDRLQRQPLSLWAALALTWLGNAVGSGKAQLTDIDPLAAGHGGQQGGTDPYGRVDRTGSGQNLVEIPQGQIKKDR